MKVSKEYKDFVMAAKHNKSNLPICCSEKQNIKFTKSLIKKGKTIKLDNFEYILGDRYTYFAFNHESNNGIINFNDKEIWMDLNEILSRQ